MNEDRPTTEELRRLFAVNEPDQIKSYLSVLEPGQRYFSGTTVPFVEPSFTGSPGGGLLVPVRSVPAPIDYVSTYVTSDEYIDSPVGLPDLPTRLLSATLNDQPRESLLITLAKLDWATYSEDVLVEMQSQFAASLAEPARSKFEGCLKDHDGKRAFLARQLILAAMREALRAQEPTAPAGALGEFPAAVICTHALGSLHTPPRMAEEKLTETVSADFAMEVLRNVDFYETEDVFSLIDREVRLWRDYGPRLKKYKLRLPPAELLLEGTGATLEELLGFGFACYAHATQWVPGKPPLLALNLGSDLDPAVLEALSLAFGATLEELQREVSTSAAEWDFLPIERSPILRRDNGLLVLEPMWAIKRATKGLYWFVHDHERDARGEAFRHKWTQAYGEMIELLVEDSLRALPPPVLGGTTYFTEEDLIEAYGKKGKKPDAVLDFGDTFLAVEIVSGRLHTHTRLDGLVDSFKHDVERFILKKARQLDEGATKLLEDESLLTGVGSVSSRRVIPCIIVGGGWPVEPLTGLYLEEAVAREGLFTHARIEPLCLVSIPELELLEGLREHQGVTAVDALRGWKASTLHRVSLKNYVIDHYPTDEPQTQRPTRMKDVVKRFFAEVIASLKLRESNNGSEA